MRSRWWSVLAFLALALVALAGCGTHGYAAPLAKPLTMTLSASGSAQSLGSATFTPMHATRFVAYYRGHQVPNTGAATPVAIRRGSCTGPTIAAVTDGTTALFGATDAGSRAISQPDPAGGVDVAVDPDASLYVVVFDHPNDASASIVACGNPLSGRQQYFDLYEATRGSAGIGLGTALMSPIVATRLDIALSQPASAGDDFSVRQGSCDGEPLLAGTIGAGATSARAVVFRSLDTQSWWLNLAPHGGQSLCARVSGK